MMQKLRSKNSYHFSKGNLINIKPGNYLRLGESDKVEEAPFRKFENDTSAILVDYLGSHPGSDVGCWSAYAKNELLVIWEDQVLQDEITT